LPNQTWAIFHNQDHLWRVNIENCTLSCAAVKAANFSRYSETNAYVDQTDVGYLEKVRHQEDVVYGDFRETIILMNSADIGSGDRL
jgi:hypothetical protein